MPVFLTLLGVAVSLLMLYAFLILPRMTDRADLDLVSTDHARGGLSSPEIPPYTLRAIRAACEAGYGIELRVRLSRDGRIVVYPNSDLRACGSKASVEELDVATLMSMRVMGSRERIATLREVLELVDGRAPLLIEPVSTDKRHTLLIRLSRMLDTYAGAFAIESSDVQTLVWFKNYRPRFARGQILPTPNQSTPKEQRLYRFATSHMLLNVRTRPDFLVAHPRSMRSPVFRICTSLLGCRAFICPITTEKERRACRAKGYFTVFKTFGLKTGHSTKGVK